MTFNIGDRVRFIDPDPVYDRIRGWEGTIHNRSVGSMNTIYSVILVNPYNPAEDQLGTYFQFRLQLIATADPLTEITTTISRLQKRQKFYQTYKTELPTWYAAYGD